MVLRILRCLLVALAWAAPGLPCDCRSPSWEKDFARVDLVFRGKITEVRRVAEGQPSGRIIVQFAVVTIWKGRATRHFTMHTELERAGCWGFWPNFVGVGNDLLVFAFERPSGWLQWEKVEGFPKGQKTVFTTHICTHTSKWSSSTDAIVQRTFGQGQPAIQE